MPSAYVHTRQLPYPTKHMANSDKKESCHLLIKHTRAVAMYTAKHMASGNLGVGDETNVWARWQMPTH